MNYETQTPQPELTYPTEGLVTDYLSASQNNDPMLYPGQRPEQSYITDGKSVYGLRVRNVDGVLDFRIQDETGNEVPADELLVALKAPPIHDRIPVLAFGANMSPGSLASKFKKVGRDDALVVPTAYGSLPGHDVVWSGAPGMNGNFIAILYKGEETAETQVQVGINFLTREQLLVMHATEMNYQLSSVVVDVEGTPVKAYYYAGQDGVYLKDNHPVAIESIPAHGRKLATASTSHLVDEMMANTEIREEIAATHPELADADGGGYVAYVESLKPQKGARTELKKFIHEVMRSKGKAVTVDNPDAIDGRESWSNPSTLPTYGEQLQGIYHHEVYRLPGQELGEWSDPELRAQVLKSVGAHFRRHKDAEQNK